MKVIQINSLGQEGCIARIMHGINQVAKDIDHKGYIAYGRGILPFDVESIKIGSTSGFLLHSLTSRLFDAQGLGSKIATKILIQRINEISPDIIHLHNIHGSYINYVILFKELEKMEIPIVWTLHDCWSFTGHCTYYDLINCDKWKTNCRKCDRKNDYPRSYFIDNSLKNYLLKKKTFTSLENLTIVTPSHWLQKEVSKSFLKDYPCIVINNGINLERFNYSYSNFRVDNKIVQKKVILGVANYWHDIKGFSDFIKLSQDLDSTFQIVLVGGTSKKQKRRGRNIIFIERTSNQEELARLYSMADIFVNPTYEDNFPTTNLESLACGTRVVTYNTGGSVESIDVDSGIVVENYDELLSYLITIDVEMKPNEKCINRANKFKDSMKYLEYINLYTELLK